MPLTHLSLDTLARWIRGLPLEIDHSPGAVLVVDLDERLGPDDGHPPTLHPGLPGVVVGLTATEAREDHPAAAMCDLVLGRDEPVLEAVQDAVAARPLAAAALVGLLRGSPGRDLHEGLLVESAVYSMLQAGPEAGAWRADRVPREREPEPEGDRVRLDRHRGTLTVTLDRPQVRNAVDAAMRHELVTALSLALVDPAITAVSLRGRGDAFCAGGDLDEFGTFADPVSAHLLRLEVSPSRVLGMLGSRVTAHLHGACVGAGIELSAFARVVRAHPSTRISLPEVSLGLVPGAGGTVSLPRRIGRWRTARLALAGEVIDAATALEWGLVDAIEPG